MNVLVTCGGGLQGLTLYKELNALQSKFNITSHLFDIHAENISKYFFDYFFQCPPVADSEKYISALFEYCANHKIDFIFPATTYDLLLLSQHKLKFKTEINCTIAICDEQFVKIFLDKISTNQFLIENGLNTPPLADYNEASHYPLIAKPKMGWGGKGLHVFKSLDAFVAAKIDNAADYLWQKLLSDFDEYSIDFSVNRQGIISDPVVRTRDATSGGFAVVSSTQSAVPENILHQLERLQKIFSQNYFCGLYNVQIIFASGHAYVTDVNPRIGTSAVMGNVIGKNLLHNFFTADQKQNNTPITTNFKVVRFLDEIYIPKIDTSKIKGIVFDFDDTLISNKDFIIARCALLYEKEKNIFNTNVHTFLQMAIAFLNEGKAHKLIDCLCEHFNVDAHQYQILESYRDCFPESLSIYNDVGHVLQQLHHKGLQLFVLTDNPVRTQEIKLNLFPHRHLFTKVYFTGAMENQKPHPGCFEIICKEYKLLPEELAMVGDNQYRDIIGSLDAGYKNAFYIKRSDSIVSHSNNIFTNYKNPERIITIQNLKQLLYHF